MNEIIQLAGVKLLELSASKLVYVKTNSRGSFMASLNSSVPGIRLLPEFRFIKFKQRFNKPWSI